MTKDLLAKFKWDIFDHPPYSSDLAPSDYYPFPKLKLNLGGQHFNNDDDLKQVINSWFRKQDTEFFKDNLKKLHDRYIKCLNVQGDYVEK